MHHSHRWRLALAFCAALAGTLLGTGLGSSSAQAESGIEMMMPSTFSSLEAGTYAQSGKRVGAGHLSVETLENGNVRILSQVGIADGAKTIAQAILTPIDGGRALRLLSQESRTFAPDGQPMGILSIDHVKRVASCTAINPTDSGPEGESRPAVQTLELPEVDHVVNVAMNLLFQPLVRGNVEAVNFQFFVCRPRPYLVSFRAKVSRHVPATDSAHEIVEIGYEPRGGLVSMIVRQFAPHLVFWFDPARANPWIAHRLPLYSSGPDVVVMRNGVSYERLENED